MIKGAKNTRMYRLSVRRSVGENPTLGNMSPTFVLCMRVIRASCEPNAVQSRLLHLCLSYTKTEIPLNLGYQNLRITMKS